MATEEDSFAKLDEWLAAQANPPSIFDVIRTGDGELLSTFILKGFRIAARQAVVDQFEEEARTTFNSEVTSVSSAILRVYDRIARVWSLQEGEKVGLLGLGGSAELEELRTTPLDNVPVEVIERVAILLDIYKSINTLLPQPNRADAWMRTPNRAPTFGGVSALEVMIGRGLDGLRETRAYLQAETAGN